MRVGAVFDPTQSADAAVNQLVELFQQLLPASLAAAVRTQADVMYVCLCAYACMQMVLLAGTSLLIGALTSVDSGRLFPCRRK
jgi:hypothetical protein